MCVSKTAMSEEDNADKTEKTRSTSSVNRRHFVKCLGTAGSIGVFGVGTTRASAEEGPISRSRAKEIIQKEVSQVALKVAKIRPEADSFELEEAIETEIDDVQWIQIPTEEADLFAYNVEEDIAEIKVNSNEFVRANFRDDEIHVEKLKTGEDVTNKGLKILKNNDEWRRALENNDVESVNTNEADAHLDRVSGISRVFTPATLESGDETMLITEIREDNSLNSVYSLSGSTDGVTTQQSAIDCFAECITFGAICSTVCVPCVSAPNQFTCAPCAACLGATGVSCAVQCGAEQLL